MLYRAPYNKGLGHPQKFFRRHNFTTRLSNKGRQNDKVVKERIKNTKKRVT